MTESCDGLEFVKGRLLDAADCGCKVSCGSNDLIGGCDDEYGHGMVLETKVLVRRLPPVLSMMAGMQW